MTIQFEIETLFELKARNQVYILAKLLNDNINWRLTDESSLSGVPIEKWVDVPRAHDKDGKQRLDLFAFALKNKDDKDKLKEGQVIELIP